MITFGLVNQLRMINKQNFLAFDLVASSLHAWLINLLCLGAIFFLSCNANKKHTVETNAVSIDSLMTFDVTEINPAVPASDTTFTISPASYVFKVVDAFGTTPKKKHKKIAEQNVDLPLVENIYYGDQVPTFRIIDLEDLKDTILLFNLYDTVKVSMLMSDTTQHEYLTTGYKIQSMTDGLVYWQFGYKVYHNGLYKLDGEVPCDYLDNNKKPLSKNIIVWQTK